MKALIVGNDELGHDELVRLAFVAGGGIASEWYNSSLISQTVFNYAKTNNFDAIIYSYSNEDEYFGLANLNPDIMLFMPSDSYNGDLQQLVLTDFTPTTDDYEFCSTYGSSQSNANGYICGQLFYIAEQRNCSLQEARICANATKDENGIINVNFAIAYDGEIKLNVGSLASVRNAGNNFTFILERVIDAPNYEIEIEDVGTVQTTALTYNYNLLVNGVHRVRYRGYNANLTSNWSEWIEIKYKILEKLLIKL